MSTGWIVLIVVLVILIGVLVGLYFFGKKAEKKQAAQQEQMDAMAQTVNMLIIDEKENETPKKPIFLPQCWRIRQNI